MTAPSPAGLSPLLDQLDEARAEPERTCEWCMARPGEWCESDCANPERRCHPSYVAQYAAERGAYSDADAALIVAAVNALPQLTAALRAVLDAVNEWERTGSRGGAPELPRQLVVNVVRGVIADALTPGADTAGATA